MASPRTIFTTSGRAIVLALVMGVGAAMMSMSLAIEHNPDHTFFAADGPRWSSLAPLGLMAFILGAGGTLSLYFAVKLLRAVFHGDES